MTKRIACALWTRPVTQPDAKAIANEHADAVRDAIDKLPPGQRAVVVLRLDGYTHAEIGARLGCSEGACWNRMYKARNNLRRLRCSLPLTIFT